MISRRVLTAFILIATLAGCSRLPLKKKVQLKPFVPPPIVVRTTPPAEPLIVGEPPPNPGLYMDPESIPFPIFGPQLELPERPKPQPTRTRPTPAPAPVEPVEPPAPPPVSVPKLTQIMSDEDARKYRSDVDEARGSAERVLDLAGRRALNGTQAELMRQVRDFLRQAQAQQDTDLVSARNLARRAAILARDLQSTLR
jgi:hypothetical protein